MSTTVIGLSADRFFSHLWSTPTDVARHHAPTGARTS